jgi:hypothetical protein
MNRGMDLRILLPAHKDAVIEFGKKQLSERVHDPMEREMQSWNARWRGEALDHYLPQGWSFGAFKGDKLCGFILGQPLLFFRGMMQTLWLECVVADGEETRALLIDCAQKWARDKHFQCALCEDGDKLKEIKTARYT